VNKKKKEKLLAELREAQQKTTQISQKVEEIKKRPMP
jgi:hypothetical protein